MQTFLALDRLPKAARTYIEGLERRVRELEEEVEGAQSKRPDSPVQVEDNVHGIQFGLNHPYAKVRYQIGRQTTPHGPRWHVDVRLEDDGTLLLMGSAALAVFGSSSNVFRVDVQDRLEVNEDAPQRDLGERLLQETLARGMDWQDGLNLIKDCDPEAVKATRSRRRGI